MIELTQDLHFSTEPFLADDSRDFRPENLDGDLGIGLNILGEHHECCRAASNIRSIGVAFGERRRESLWLGRAHR